MLQTNVQQVTMQAVKVKQVLKSLPLSSVRHQVGLLWPDPYLTSSSRGGLAQLQTDKSLPIEK